MKITPKVWHRARAAYSDFIEYILNSVEDLPIGESVADQVSRLLWQLSIEDAIGIGTLMEKRCVGSVRSLIRPQFESLVRGAWVLHCCDNSKLQAIVEYRSSFPMLGPAVKDLTEISPRFMVLGDEVPFHVLDTRCRDAMNDQTHRGVRALARRSIGNSRGATGIDDDELALFHLGASIGGIAAAAFLERTGKAAMASELLMHLNQAVAAWQEVDAKGTHTESQ